VKISAAILTISDSCYQGLREDLSGPRLKALLTRHEFQVVLTNVLPDEIDPIVLSLRESVSKAQLVVTTGGTGISPRDITPEATRQACDRLIEGIPELMRAEGLKHTPMAALSRALCGSIGSSVIVNLPGSPAGAEQSLMSVLHLIPHALDLLAGKTEHSSDHQDSER
jgi:molybdenum cofactor synthesis domain-containing protein